MNARPDDGLRAELQSKVAVLNLGRPRPVLHSAGRAAGGSRMLVRLTVTLEHVAISMDLRAHGRLGEAWATCRVAARSLPPSLRYDAPSGALARLAPAPPTGDIDAHLACWAARLVFREQYELADLRDRFVLDRAAARDELIEVYIEYLCTGEVTDKSRKAFLARATRLRRFAGSLQGDVSQSVWTDVGGLDGLHEQAVSRLGERLGPAPWCGLAGTADLPVAVDRLRVWESARRHHSLSGDRLTLGTRGGRMRRCARPVGSVDSISGDAVAPRGGRPRPRW